MGTIIRKIYRSGTFRNVVTPTVGFGVAGALWGLDIYRGAIESNEAFINPFSFISGAFLFGIIGSASLVIFSGDVKKILKVVGIGTVGWILAFLLPAVLNATSWLLVAGAVITPLIGLIIILTNIDPVPFLHLPLSVLIAHLWIEFLLTGIIIALVYGFLFKKKIVHTSMIVGTGFVAGSFAAPTIGNITGLFVEPSFVAFFVTLSLMGGIFGLLFWHTLLKGRVDNES